MAGSKPYRVHPAAWVEIEAAADWYQEHSADASVWFVAAILDALESVSRAPQRWPVYLHNTRRFVVQRFPFSIIYLDEPEAVNVLAVAHNKRRPGYWKKRL
jgi:toxin ParE1/3/4